MRRINTGQLMGAVGIVVLGCSFTEAASTPTAPSQEAAMPLTLRSSVFSDGGTIPAEYTCDGANVSPPLQWMDSPTGTKTFALIVHDPDAPMKTWIHWVIYNLPPITSSLSRAMAVREQGADAARQGLNDFGEIGYGGPCPPSGTHRYIFTLYALDTMLDLPARATAQQLERALAGHVLGQAQLTGTYRRQR